MTAGRKVRLTLLLLAFACFVAAGLSVLVVHRATRIAADEPIAPTSSNFFRLDVALAMVAGFSLAGGVLAVIAVVITSRRPSKNKKGSGVISKRRRRTYSMPQPANREMTPDPFVAALSRDPFVSSVKLDIPYYCKWMRREDIVSTAATSRSIPSRLRSCKFVYIRG